MNYRLFFLFLINYVPFSQAAEWVLPEQQEIPTVFFQGMMDSHKQCAKYCGPNGFQALTGEHVSCPHSAELIHTPFIGKELDEINLDRSSSYSWYNPLRFVDAVQRYAFAKQLANYGYTVTGTQANGSTVTTHAVDLFKINFGQARDIEECTKKIELLDQSNPSKSKILWGVSRGAGAVFNAHAHKNYQDVRMVVLEGCFDTIDHAIALRAPSLVQKSGLTSLFQAFMERVTEYRRNGASPINAVDSFPKDVPVVFITSKADLNVPMACTRKLIERLQERDRNPVHVLELEQSGHNFYALGTGSDQKRYLEFMHTIYKKYNLPHIPGHVKEKQD